MSNRFKKLLKRKKVARVELSNENWVEYRENLKAMDRFAVQDAVTLQFSEGGNKASLGMMNDQRNALLGRIITAWSYNTPIPSNFPQYPADVVIGEAMDLDDYNVLAEAVQPLLDKIQGKVVEDPKAPSTT
jgi:hypothetical protein